MHFFIYYEIGVPITHINLIRIGTYSKFEKKLMTFLLQTLNGAENIFLWKNESIKRIRWNINLQKINHPKKVATMLFFSKIIDLFSNHLKKMQICFFSKIFCMDF